MKTIYLLIGCPGIGKSWIANQLGTFGNNSYVHVNIDDYKGDKDGFNREIRNNANETDKIGVIAEIPFSISEYKEPLENEGFNVECVFIKEDPEVISQRYLKRDLKEIPKGHLTRQKTYEDRAKEYGSFIGNTIEVLNYLKTK